MRSNIASIPLFPIYLGLNTPPVICEQAIYISVRFVEPLPPGNNIHRRLQAWIKVFEFLRLGSRLLKSEMEKTTGAVTLASPFARSQKFSEPKNVVTEYFPGRKAQFIHPLDGTADKIRRYFRDGFAAIKFEGVLDTQIVEIAPCLTAWDWRSGFPRHFVVCSCCLAQVFSSSHQRGQFVAEVNLFHMVKSFRTGFLPALPIR